MAGRSLRRLTSSTRTLRSRALSRRGSGSCTGARSSSRTAGRTSIRTSRSATCSSRTPAAVSGTRRRRTATPASPRAGTWTCGAITIARDRSCRCSRRSTSRPRPARASGAAEDHAGVRREPRAQPLPAAGERRCRWSARPATPTSTGSTAPRACGSCAAARHVTSDQDSARRLLDAAFDPDREILLTMHPPRRVRSWTTARMRRRRRAAPGTRRRSSRENTREIVIDADGAAGRVPAAGGHVLSGLDRATWTAWRRPSTARTLGARHPAAEGPARGPFHVRRAGLLRAACGSRGGDRRSLIWTSAAGFVAWRSGARRQS